MDYHALAEDLLGSIIYRTMPTEKPRQLSIGERGILNYLHFHRDGVLSGELSRDLGITTGRTAVTLRTLERKGLIRRSASPADRRCVIVCITDEGAAAAEDFRRNVLSSMEYVLRSLGEEDALEYVRIVKRIAGFDIHKKTP